MGTIIQKLLSWYKYFNEDIADPRTTNYYLISSPWLGLGLLGFYLFFVYSLGPQLMKNREPFNLNRILQIYNLVQILLNMYMFYQLFILIILLNTYMYYQASTKAWLTTYRFVCEPIDFSWTSHALEVTKLVWLYFLVKFLDLLDTVFFILRKKNNQVTFLHIYHHVGMVLLTWGCVKYFPGGHGTFIGWINSFVHIIMYTYYLLASMKIDISSWKRHITHLQLTQFAMILFHTSLLFLTENCNYPIFIAYILIPQNFFMIILFGEFYYETYIKEKSVVSKKTKINDISTEENGKLKKQ